MNWLHALETALRLLSALILAQTLWFKFSGEIESVWIFTQLGVEPWGRIAAGAVEAIAAVLFLSAETSVWAAWIVLPVMATAITAHIFVLGIVVMNDGGLLFALAIFILCSAVFIVVRNQQKLRRCMRH
ncbi:MAG: DoxX family protein [Spirochaetes bacterium]|nr:DoxX family protein [Spirochaetota bacterium]